MRGFITSRLAASAATVRRLKATSMTTSRRKL
jgi:hypothetical protein